MKTLTFTAHTTAENADMGTESKVADVLVTQLGKYGFYTLPQGGDRVAISVDEHTLPLSITCEGRNEDGFLVCEIVSYPDEEQGWLDRITEQSLMNQLAQAVENTLKEQEQFGNFQWKENALK